jgi:hypothetical protein
MKNIYDFIRHNFGFCLGCFLTPFVLWYAVGCQSQVVSIITPSKMVTRDELLTEVDIVLAQAEQRIRDLDRQDLIRNTIFNSMSELLEGNPTSPAGIALIITNLLGIGAVIDNARKRTLIATLKNRLPNVNKTNDNVPKTT